MTTTKKPKTWAQIKAEHDQQIEYAAQEYIRKADRACYLYYSPGRLNVMADDENTDDMNLATGERMHAADYADARLFIQKIAGKLPFIVE